MKRDQGSWSHALLNGIQLKDGKLQAKTKIKEIQFKHQKNSFTIIVSEQ